MPKSHYSQHDIYALMQAASENTIPAHIFHERTVFIETTEDELLADAILIKKSGQAFAAEAGAR